MALAESRKDGASEMTDPEVADVCVLGLGYVGLPTAAVLATHGRKVAGVDVSSKVIDTINAGEIHIVEPELDALVRAAVAAEHLQAHPAPVPARAYLICVPTPFKDDHAPDLHFVEEATRALLPVLRPGALVVLESTSPPGTTRNVVARILEEAGFVAGESVHVAHAPERVLPGAVVREVVENARVVGGVTPACTEACADFYEGFVRGDVLRTSAEGAELSKLSENAFRDVNIAFANELANICTEVGVDVWEVIDLANRHPRVNVLRPGPGVGGHCIAVDPWFLVAAAPDQTPLIRMARTVNDARPGQVVERVRAMAARFKAPRIACLGLSYKPDIDDTRESPAMKVVEALRDAALGELLVAEPHLDESPLDGLELHPPLAAVEAADIVVILVAHRVFRRLPRKLLTERSVVDTVGLLA